MSLWGVLGVMGSPVERLVTSFWHLSGSFLKPWGVILGAFWGHFGSLGGHWVTFGAFGARQKLYTPRIYYARSILEAKWSKWTKTGFQHGAKMVNTSVNKPIKIWMFFVERFFGGF